MGADMSVYSLATPVNRVVPIDFDAGRAALAAVADTSLFAPDLEDYDLINNAISELGLDLAYKDGDPVTLELLHVLGGAIIDALEDAWDGRQITWLTVADYRIYVTGGLSWGDYPTEAAAIFWFTDLLPVTVMNAMGFIVDYGRPLSRSNGNPGPVTDSDVVDAIALGLGTKPEWEGADELEWIADTISAVRRHPGDVKPADYLRSHTEDRGRDPLTVDYLAQYVSDDARGDDPEES